LNLPDFITGLNSACFEETGALWLLHTQEHENFPRRFVLSRTDSHYEKWVNYLIRDETDESLLKRIFSLGSPIERPVSVTCGKENVYILTYQYFQDTMQINVYLFDREERKLIYITGYFPVEEKGKVSTHFSIEDTTLFVFQNRELVTVRENTFPDIMIFDESGEMFFSENDQKILMFFVPDLKREGKITGRLMKRTFINKEKL